MPSSKRRGLIDILLGFQWGDESKGGSIQKLLKLLVFRAVVRYNGGANAGHCLCLDDGTVFVTHILPSGVVFPNVLLLLGNMVVINPVQMLGEIEQAEKNKFEVWPRLFISDKASLVTPHHILLDKASEWWRTKESGKAIGTTNSGIGPAFADRASRDAIYMRHLKSLSVAEFNTLAVQTMEKQSMLLNAYRTAGFEFDTQKLLADINAWFSAVNTIRESNTIVNMADKVESILAEGHDILAEGAQGIMLDVLHGDIPFTTSSSTWAGGVLDGLGVGPDEIRDIYGVCKPYPTKVGGGPFPSRMELELEKRFQELGGEKGATTGRPRMCGYPDMVQLRYAIELHKHFGKKIKLILAKVDIYPEEVTAIPMIREYAYNDTITSKRLQFPLSGVAGVHSKDVDAWVLPAGKNKHDNKCLNLDIFINQMINELYDLSHIFSVYMVCTGPKASEYFLYPQT